VRGLKDIYEKNYTKFAKEQLELIEEISSHIEAINSKVTQMINQRKKANKIQDSTDCDKLELLVDDEIWPMTKYRELLFTN